MKAYVLEDINRLIYKDINVPTLDKGEVLVHVKAVGICGSDIPRIYKTGAHVHPIIPGHEFSGEVVECGSDAIQWKGKRVGIFPLIPCMQCDCCKKKLYEMCRNYSYLGSRCNGGFAEYSAVPSWNLIELPKNVSFGAAALLEPLSVSAHAVRRVTANADKNECFAVWGLGTIGLMVVSLLKTAGFNNIICIGKKTNQRRFVEDLGIASSMYIDATNESVNNRVCELTDGKGPHAVFECVGRNETIAGCVSVASPGGMVMLVGNPNSDICFEKEVYWKILRNELTVLGTWNSAYTHSENDDWHYALQLLKDGSLEWKRFISHKINFDELKRGLEIMRDKKGDYIKIMIEE